MNVVGDVLLFLAGFALLCIVLDSAMRTFVLPRAVVSRLTRLVFRGLRIVFDFIARRFSTYEGRDRVMALYAPFGLLVSRRRLAHAADRRLHAHVPGRGRHDWAQAVELSGSSLFTLGFVVPPQTAAAYILCFAEAASGLAVLALLIAYLPTIYGAFSRRELLVAQLAVRAGTPPTAVELLERYHAIGWNDQLPDLWSTWEGLVRRAQRDPHDVRGPRPSSAHRTRTARGSPRPARFSTAPRWPTRHCRSRGHRRPGCASVPATSRCASSPISTGSPTTPTRHRKRSISISREEFDDAYRRLGGAGVPIRPDRERAWRDFAGWRVNYDSVLLALAGLTMAPYAPWSSDRSLRVRRPPIMHLRRATSHEGPAARPGG